MKENGTLPSSYDFVSSDERKMGMRRERMEGNGTRLSSYEFLFSDERETGMRRT